MSGEALEIVVPLSADVEALGGLFHGDMEELGVQTRREDQQELARRVIEDLEREDPPCLCWVAREESGRLCGVLLAHSNWSPKFAGRSLWIESLYVPEWGRRRGIGRQLVDHLLDWAEDHGVKGIDIEAYRGNTPASILYRTMGFRRLGRERFSYTVEE